MKTSTRITIGFDLCCSSIACPYVCFVYPAETPLEKCSPLWEVVHFTQLCGQWWGLMSISTLSARTSSGLNLTRSCACCWFLWAHPPLLLCQFYYVWKALFPQSSPLTLTLFLPPLSLDSLNPEGRSLMNAFHLELNVPRFLTLHNSSHLLQEEGSLIIAEWDPGLWT